MFSYVASVTLHEHFMNALNAQNGSVNLKKAKNTISALVFCCFFPLIFPCKVLLQIAYLPKIKPSQFSSILQLFINLNIHSLNRGAEYFRHFGDFAVVAKISSNSSLLGCPCCVNEFFFVSKHTCSPKTCVKMKRNCLS